MYDIAKPENELFIPRNYVSQPSFWPPIDDLPSSTLVDTFPGFAIPMPEQPFSSSPAWDLSSHTPISEAEHDPDVGSMSLARPSRPLDSRVRDEIQHVLLDLQLLNASLHVNLHKAGSEKKVVTTITSAEGQLSI